MRLWRGGALCVNPEVNRGLGLSDTLGVAGCPSGEAYKVGQVQPYLRLQRAFVRQRWNLGAEAQSIEPGPNQLGGALAADNVTLTVGTFSVVDVFDSNAYAHDPRSDFLNWAVIDAAAIAYAADAWGYTVGAALEWTRSWWTLRGGFSDLSNVPNSKSLEPGFKVFELVAEFESRYELGGYPGKARLLGFVNHGRMGAYNAAVSLGQATGAAPDTAPVRQVASRPGVVLNVEQEPGADLGPFARLSWNDGCKEAYEFTDVIRSASVGVVWKATAWNRPSDTFGVAGAFNAISAAARAYFAAGGLGLLIGDGQLPHAASENILETFYSLRIVDHVTAAANYQYVVNPAYNRDRGPVWIFGLRSLGEL